MKAAVASLKEMNSEHFQGFISKLEDFQHDDVRYCRRWEYPWVWFNGIEPHPYPKITRVLDIGSGGSPMPRWMKERAGFDVTMVEIDPAYSGDCRIVRDERLPYPNNHFDLVTSFSVIEHQPAKIGAILEIARVLKSGGFLGITFDLVEQSMGMTYPRDEIPMTFKLFEAIVWNNQAFGNTHPPEWNVEDMPDFLEWHKTTHPNHTYVCGGAILRKQ